jgi:hypothetical protein
VGIIVFAVGFSLFALVWDSRKGRESSDPSKPAKNPWD